MKVNIINLLKTGITNDGSQQDAMRKFGLHATAVTLYNIAEKAIKDNDAELKEILENVCIINGNKITIDEEWLT